MCRFACLRRCLAVENRTMRTSTTTTPRTTKPQSLVSSPVSGSVSCESSPPDSSVVGVPEPGSGFWGTGEAVARKIGRNGKTVIGAVNQFDIIVA